MKPDFTALTPDLLPLSPDSQHCWALPRPLLCGASGLLGHKYLHFLKTESREGLLFVQPLFLPNYADGICLSREAVFLPWGSKPSVPVTPKARVCVCFVQLHLHNFKCPCVFTAHGEIGTALIPRRISGPDRACESCLSY